MKVAAIGDLHVKEDQVQPWRDVFVEVGREADVLVLAGDLTDLGKPAEARSWWMSCGTAPSRSSPCSATTTTNVAPEEEVAEIIRASGVHLLDWPELRDQRRRLRRREGLRRRLRAPHARLLRGARDQAVRGGDGERGAPPGNAMRRVPRGRTVVVLHYAPIAETVAEEPPEIFPFLGSSRLAETIDRFEVSAGRPRPRPPRPLRRPHRRRPTRLQRRGPHREADGTAIRADRGLRPGCRRAAAVTW
jgi:hypothetical protein